MKISLIAPSNLEKFSLIIGKSKEEINRLSKEIGDILAKNSEKLTIVFNYSGVIKLIGNSYKENGRKIEMLYTENDYDWFTDIYMGNLDNADIKTKKESWHDMLLSLVTDANAIICAGLSAGVFVELGYIKWNLQENKGCRNLIFIKEFLKDGKIPKELEHDLKEIITYCPIKKLSSVLNKIKDG